MTAEPCKDYAIIVDFVAKLSMQWVRGHTCHQMKNLGE